MAILEAPSCSWTNARSMPIDRLIGEREALVDLLGPCVVTDANGIIIEATAAAAAAAAGLFGIEQRFMIGKPIQSFVAPERRRAFRAEITALADDRDFATFTTRFERRDRVAFDAEVRAVRLDDGLLILAVRDITEAVRSESHLWELNAELEQRIAERTAELELQNAYLGAIMRHIPAGLVIADAATGEITMVNEHAHEISGSTPRTLPLSSATWRAARGTREDGTPYAPDEWPLARALTGELVGHERIVVEDPPGTKKVLEMSAAPIVDPGGDVIAAVGVFEDVTAASARARAAAEFVANAAHELRTPLAAIVSGVDVLEAGAKDLPAERDRFLAHIAREAARLTRLSAALLQLARLQSGVEAPRAEIVPLAPILASVAAGLRPADGVKLDVRCPNEAAAIASRGLLEQALTSIATNAARYTESGRITLSVAQPNGRVRIRVRDTGHGMTPEALARAGERFYRGDPGGPAGFGLGLAIARESIEAMGGSLALESTPGEGTTADIVLPAARVVAA
jgi:PAS domain S-box-containing protein